MSETPPYSGLALARRAASREDCEALDRADPLGAFRDRFILPDGKIHLDGNSLGALPRSTPGRLARTVEAEWGSDLIAGWTRHRWMSLPQRVGARLAPLIGAGADEVVAADSTSVNLYKLALSALALRPGRRVIVCEQGDFPTDAYILQEIVRASAGRLELRTVERKALPDALDEEVALLCLTQVHYVTGALHDMTAMNAKALAVGALTLWDLSHSAGALEIELDRTGADLAAGCGYKYLNGGPGAPGFMFVARRLQADIRGPIAGWIGHETPFAFSPSYVPAPGSTRMLSGTPSVLALAALEEGVRTFEGASMAKIRAKSVALGELFLQLVDARCAGMGLTACCPPDPDRRGSQVSLRHPEAEGIVGDLAAAGVIGDFRPPDVLRFGLTPLYTRFVDVFDAVEMLARILHLRRR